MYRIFVPTRGRTDRQISRVSYALDYLNRPVVYVVPKSEVSFWQGEDVKYLTVPDKFKFSDVRQFILGQPGKYHVVLDDDLYPAERMDQSHLTNLRQFPLQERLYHLRPMFAIIGRLLRDGWTHGGISARQGNNRVKGDYKSVCREMRFHFYNASVVRNLGFDFRRTVTKQDLDFTLWMLERGIPNVVVFRYCHEQAGNNKMGGCALYRTDRVLTEGAERLAELHSQFVTVVERRPKHAWGGNSRKDVHIRWQKAYQSGLEYVKNLRRQDPSTLDTEDRAVLRLQSKMPVLPDPLST